MTEFEINQEKIKKDYKNLTIKGKKEFWEDIEEFENSEHEYKYSEEDYQNDKNYIDSW